MSLPSRDLQSLRDLLVVEKATSIFVGPEPATVTAVRSWPRKTVVQDLLVLCGLFLVVLVIQISVGAYQGERGNYSDEAAHFMNGLLVRDYLRDGLGQNPIDFAERYYLSYPKIAPGMWPPLFHIVLGLFIVAGWPPFGAALVLLALATTWIAWRLYRIVAADASPTVALLMAGLFVLTPMIVNLTSAVMLDIIVAAFALEATYWLALFFRSEDWRHAALFGLFAAFCCLTKGNGVALVLVPPLLMAFTGQFRLLRHRGLYIAAGIVVFLAVPALVLSYRLDAAIGDFGPIGPSQVATRLKFYGTYIWTQLGTVSLTLAVLAFATGKSGRTNDRRGMYAPAMKALVAAALIFHAVNPHLVYVWRYLALAIAPLLALIPLGVNTAVKGIRVPHWRATAEMVLLASVVANFFVAKPTLAWRASAGFRQTVDILESASNGGLAGRRMLIVGDENGEGAFVSEVAIRHSQPAPTVIRGSKLIAADDWAGRNFRMRFASANDVMQELEDLHVEYLVMDQSVSAAAAPYHWQIDELVATHQDRLEQVHAIDGSHPIVTYRLKYPSAGPAKKLRVELTNSLGRTLER